MVGGGPDWLDGVIKVNGLPPDTVWDAGLGPAPGERVLLGLEPGVVDDVLVELAGITTAVEVGRLEGVFAVELLLLAERLPTTPDVVLKTGAVPEMVVMPSGRGTVDEVALDGGIVRVEVELLTGVTGGVVSPLAELEIGLGPIPVLEDEVPEAGDGLLEDEDMVGGAEELVELVTNVVVTEIVDDGGELGGGAPDGDEDELVPEAGGESGEAEPDDVVKLGDVDGGGGEGLGVVVSVLLGGTSGCVELCEVEDAGDMTIGNVEDKVFAGPVEPFVPGGGAWEVNKAEVMGVGGLLPRGPGDCGGADDDWLEERGVIAGGVDETVIVVRGIGPVGGVDVSGLEVIDVQFSGKPAVKVGHPWNG